MTCFASIGVRQIQGYLARSRRLWGRRGASDMLAYLTDTSGAADRIEERSFETAGEILQGFPGVTVNDDAVDVDSVLNIRGEDPGEVRKATKALALNIKLHLPAAHVHTSLREAAAYHDVIRAEDEEITAETRQYPPSMIEFPLVHHCDECSSGTASEKRETSEDGPQRLCADCLSRLSPRGRNETLRRSVSSRSARQEDREPALPQGSVQQGFMVEQVMLREQKGLEKLGQVEHFKELAQLGDLGPEGARTHTGNHVATIFADGNGFGKLFRELRAAAAESEDGLQELRRVSRAVKDATKQALRKAIEEITDDQVAAANRMPAVPHILGGDDILVTVPATRAWPFLIAFLKHLKQAAEGDAFGSGAEKVSFSAGMVICKLAYPIGDQVELATALLRTTKEAVRGDDWSFAWLDVTSEGPTPSGRFLTLDDWGRIEELRTLARRLGDDERGNAARATLRQELRIRDERDRTLHLRHRAGRLPGASGLLDAAFGRNWERATTQGTEELLTVLNIMRWYA